MGLRGAGHVVKVIAQGGRQHPRRAVGWGGDHLTTRGIFLVHRHGIDAHPVVDGVGGSQVHAPFGQQFFVDALGPPLDLQAPGQDPVRGQPPVNTVAHHLPQPLRARFQVFMSATLHLVGTFHGGDGLAGSICHLQHLGGGFERVGDWRPLVGGFACGQFLFGHHEPAADGIENLAQGHVALGVGGHQDHAIGVTGQGRVIVKDQVNLGVEVQRRQTIRVQHMLGLGHVQRRLGLVLIIGFRNEPSQPEDRGPVGGVPNPGKGQRAVQRCAHASKLKGRGAHHVQKPRGGHHGPHRVGRGRANAHFEHLEYG
mmetsp:Transcript_23948/g.43664  ORF Transcript_23948/g.43664 Transcript_23948/m.43664 type:complete len:312 (-) Transcript_23948:151-1086(-)